MNTSKPDIKKITKALEKQNFNERNIKQILNQVAAADNLDSEPLPISSVTTQPETMKKFTYTRVDDYLIENLKKNHIQKILGEHSYQHLYNEHCKYFDFYEIPVATTDGVAMSHWWDIEAAKSEGKTTMPVIIVDGFDQEDLVQFICFSMFFSQVNRAVKYEIIKYLRNYLENTENGKQWKKRILEKHTFKTINHVIGYITGYGDSQVSAIQTMARKDIKYLNDEKYTQRQIRDLAEKDGKIKGTDPTKESRAEKHRVSRELKKAKQTESIAEIWNTLGQFMPFGFHLFEGDNVIMFKEDRYWFSPTYARVENGVLYLGIVSEDKRFKMDIIFEEDPAFKDGTRYKQHDGDEWIEDEQEPKDESHAISREVRVPQKIDKVIKQKPAPKSAAQKELNKIGRELARENPGIDRIDKPTRHNVQRKKDHA